MIKCKICGGNDSDMPCAYPSECLRDQRTIESLRQQLDTERLANEIIIADRDKAKDAAHEWKRRAEDRAAMIDTLMFEYCPEKMNRAQIAEYEKNQEKDNE
ncbi:unnamed protein product [marine sediment metagenome]|uniref:Uncharacterized protein n=1 Tax=marine sediment metagenome TaxID=412755 RepID=X0TEM3_9ZZZZ